MALLNNLLFFHWSITDPSPMRSLKSNSTLLPQFNTEKMLKKVALRYLHNAVLLDDSFFYPSAFFPIQSLFILELREKNRWCWISVLKPIVASELFLSQYCRQAQIAGLFWKIWQTLNWGVWRSWWSACVQFFFFWANKAFCILQSLLLCSRSAS